MAATSTFSVDAFWPKLEKERSHVIYTQRKNFSQALRDLRESVDKNNDEQNQQKKADAEATKANKKEIAEKLRQVECFITPQASHVVKRGLSDLRVYLGRRLTIVVVDQK